MIPVVTASKAVYDKTTGDLLYVGPASAPVPASAGSVALPSAYSDQTFVWSKTARGMIEDVARVEAMLIAGVKAESERRKMMRLSTGGAKKTEYSDKAGEVRYFNSLGGTVSAILAAINLMTADRRAALFPYATADAAAFGDTLDKAIARFSGGMSRSASVPTLAAFEAKTCAAIKAATTPTAKRAAAAATWPA